MVGKRFERKKQAADRQLRGQGSGGVQDISTRYDAVRPQAVEPQTPAPDEPAPGTRPDKTGKIAAVIATGVMLVGAVGLTIAILIVRNQVPVKIESVVESVDATNGCTWQLAIELRNNSSDVLTVSRIAMVLNRGMRGGTMQKMPPLEPDQTDTYLVSFRLPAQDVCTAVDEINHGNIIFHFTDGSSESLRLDSR